MQSSSIRLLTKCEVKMAAGISVSKNAKKEGKNKAGIKTFSTKLWSFIIERRSVTSRYQGSKISGSQQ